MSNRRKRPRGRVALAFGAAIAIVVAILPGSSSADPEPTLEEVRVEVRELEEQAETAAERANEAKDRAERAGRRLEQLAEDIKRQETAVAGLRDQIGAYAAAEYRSGSLDPTLQLLMASDPDEFIAQMNSSQAFRGQQAEILRSLEVEKKRLAETRAEADQQRQELKVAEERAEKKLNEADAKYERGQKLLERLTEEERERLRQLEEERRQQQVSRGGGEGRVEEPPAPPPPGSGRGATALEFARQQLGEPYVFGGAGPDSWDCSGLTMRAWEAAGVSLPHSSRQQYSVSPKISQSDLQPGDLVIFYSDMHHVGLYAGNGQVLHAPKPGGVVEYIPMSYMPVTGTIRPG